MKKKKKIHQIKSNRSVLERIFHPNIVNETIEGSQGNDWISGIVQIQ